MTALPTSPRGLGPDQLNLSRRLAENVRGPLEPQLPLGVRERREREERPGLVRIVGDSISSEWAGAWALRQAQRGGFEVDPDFDPFEDETWDRLTEGLPRELWDRLADARSMTHGLRIREQAIEVMEARGRLRQAGVVGAIGQLGAAIFDPVFILAAAGAGAASGGAGTVAAGATRAGRLGKIVRGALVATPEQSFIRRAAVRGAPFGVSEAAVQGYITTQDPEQDAETILYAGLGAMILGGVGGEALASAARRARKQIELNDVRRLSGETDLDRMVEGGVLTPKGREYFREVGDPARKRQIVDDMIDGLDDLPDAEKAALREIDPDDFIRDFPDDQVIGVSDARFTGPPPTGPAEGAPGRGAAAPPGSLGPDDIAKPEAARSTDRLDMAELSDDPARNSAVRFSMAGAMGGKAAGALERLFSSAFVEDALRKASGLGNRWNASSWGTRIQREVMGEYATEYRQHLSGWLAETGQRSTIRSRRAFMEEVGRASRLDPEQRAPGAVADMAAMQDRLNARIWAVAEWHGVPGFTREASDPRYFTRMWKPSAVRAANHHFGRPAVERLLARAFVEGSSDLSEDAAARIARGFLRTIQNLDGPDAFRTGRVFHGDERTMLREILEREAEHVGLTPQQIDELIPQIADPLRPSASPRARRRMAMNEQTALDDLRWDDGRPLAIEDLLENNAAVVAEHYTRHVVGLTGETVALRRIAQVAGREEPFTWQSLRDALQQDMTDRGLTQRAINERMKKVDTIRKSLRGMPLHDDTNALRLMRTLRMWNDVLISGGFAIAQLPELANVVVVNGFRSSLRRIPAFGEAQARLRSGKPEPRLAKELEALGFGMLRKIDSLTDQVGAMIDDGITETIEGAGRGRLVDRLVEGVEVRSRIARRFAHDVSGLAWVTATNQKMAAAVAAQHWADIATGRGVMSAARMADMGIDEAMSHRIIAQLRSNVVSMEGSRLRSMRLDEWTDDEAAAAFVQALFRFSQRAVQENDIGQMSRWMTHPVGRLIMQYRVFVAGAWEKQTLHKLDMRDVQAFNEAWTAMLIAGAAYAGREHLRAMLLPEDERAKVLEDRLTDEAIAKAAFQRAGWASIMPMLYDATIPRLTGTEPQFQYRNTGPMGGFASQQLQNPTIALIDAAPRLLELPRRAVGSLAGDEEKRIDQPYLRSLMPLLPFRNIVGVSEGYHSLVGEFPERPRR